MSTNFYVHYKVGEHVTINWHIGKYSNGGLNSFSGRVFPTVKAWVQFLRFNKEHVQVIDEYGVDYEVEGFIADYLLTSRDDAFYQLKWVRENIPERLVGFLHDWENPGEGMYWVDESSGALFYNGDFC